MSVTNQDMLDILKKINNYFKLRLPNSDDNQEIEDVYFINQGLKKGYYEQMEFWINESPYYETEYICFAINEKGKKVAAFLSKEPEEELRKECLPFYEKLQTLLMVKVFAF